MPYISNRGVKIFYETAGLGSPLVLAHGMSMSGEDWKEWGYVDLLTKNHRVVLIDARGHGRSDKPRGSENYAKPLRVADHMAVLDHLGIEQAHFWGYSMGASNCFGIALVHPERVRSLILGGYQPFAAEDLAHLEYKQPPRPFEGLPDTPDPIMDLLKNGAESWIRFWAQNINLTPGLRERLAANNFAALMDHWDAPDPWKAGVRDRIKDLSVPCLFYAGEKESVVLGAEEAAHLMPNASYRSFAGMNHFDIFDRTDQVLPTVMAFIAQVERGKNEV